MRKPGMTSLGHLALMALALMVSATLLANNQQTLQQDAIRLADEAIAAMLADIINADYRSFNKYLANGRRLLVMTDGRRGRVAVTNFASGDGALLTVGNTYLCVMLELEPDRPIHFGQIVKDARGGFSCQAVLMLRRSAFAYRGDVPGIRLGMLLEANDLEARRREVLEARADELLGGVRLAAVDSRFFMERPFQDDETVLEKVVLKLRWNGAAERWESQFTATAGELSSMVEPVTESYQAMLEAKGLTAVQNDDSGVCYVSAAQAENIAHSLRGECFREGRWWKVEEYRRHSVETAVVKLVEQGRGVLEQTAQKLRDRPAEEVNADFWTAAVTNSKTYDAEVAARISQLMKTVDALCRKDLAQFRMALEDAFRDGDDDYVVDEARRRLVRECSENMALVIAERVRLACAGLLSFDAAARDRATAELKRLREDEATLAKQVREAWRRRPLKYDRFTFASPEEAEACPLDEVAEGLFPLYKDRSRVSVNYMSKTYTGICRILQDKVVIGGSKYIRFDDMPEELRCCFDPELNRRVREKYVRETRTAIGRKVKEFRQKLEDEQFAVMRFELLKGGASCGVLLHEGIFVLPEKVIREHLEREYGASAIERKLLEKSEL